MAEPTTAVANDGIERRKDVDDKPLSSKFWLGEIKAAQTRDQSWQKRADKVIERYRDERTSDRGSESQRRANILWSNTETLKSTLFQGIGNPDVRRRFPKKGQDDRAARQAALVLERGLSYCADSYDAECQIEACIEDHLLAGRGTPWIVYDAEVNEYQAEDAEEGEASDNPQMQAPSISSQLVKIEHVFYKDYLTSAGRKWSDVWWVSRAHNYSRDELKKYFPKHAKEVPLEVEVEGYDSGKKSKKEDEDTFKRSRVWEIWDKSKRERVYVAEGYKHILQRDEDPYKLKDFFPTVEPLYGVKTTSSLTPIPEYTLYQDQAEELDVITTRLARLTDALKRRGIYDASAEGSDNQLSKLASAGDNEFLPYRGMAVLMEKGGLAGVFQVEDLKPLIEVIDKLQQHRITLVQTIYEITGISDIIRGASNPNETATAQKIKGQFGSLRLQKRQKRIQAFIRDLFRLKAEIMAEHFAREQLSEMTGIDMPTQAEQMQAKQMLANIEQQQKMAQQMAAQQAQQRPPNGALPPNGAAQPMQRQQQMQAMPGMNGRPGMNGAQPPQIDPKMMQQLIATAKAVTWEEIASILRSDQRRGYKVDIETDATSAMDQETEKQQRIEFLTAMQGFMEKTIPALVELPQLAPALVPLFKENAMFAVGAFRAGRTMEETYEDAFDQLEQVTKAALAKGPKPDPEEKKIQLEAQARQMEFQFKAKEAEQDRQLKQQEFAHTAKLKDAEFQHQAKLEEFKAQKSAELEQYKLQQEMDQRAAEFDFQQSQAAQTAELERQKFGFEQERHGQELDLKRSSAEQDYMLKAYGAQQDADLADRKLEQDGEAGVAGEEPPARSAPRRSGGMVGPLGDFIMALQQSVQQQAETVGQALQAIVQQQQTLTAQVGEIVSHMDAPVEIVRDPKTGKAAGVKRGNRTRQIMRGPDNRITGTA